MARACLLALLAAATCAAAGATTPAVAATTVSPSGVRLPALASNPEAELLVAWERRVAGLWSVEARAGRGVRGLGRKQRLGRSRSSHLSVAVGEDGTRAVQWTETGDGIRRVRVAVARPYRPFGQPRIVADRPSSLGSVGVAVQPDGRVVSVYRGHSGELRFALAAPRGTFGATRRLALAPEASLETVAVDPRDGAVLVAYTARAVRSPESDAILSAPVSVATLSSADLRFGAPVRLSGSDPAETPGAEAVGSVVSGPGGVAVGSVVSGPGGAAVALRVSTPDHHLVRVATRAPDGTWRPAHTAARVPADGDSRYPSSVKAALPSGGAVLAGWLEARSASEALGRRGSDQPVGAAAAAAARAGLDAPFLPPFALAPAAPSITGFGMVAASSTTYAGWTDGATGTVWTAVHHAGAGRVQRRRVLARDGDGDGDVPLAGAGGRAYAAWTEDGRLRVSALR